MGRQESAEAKVAAAHGGEGPSIRSRTGTEHSMRQGDAESRVRSPSDAGRQAAEPPMAQRQATRHEKTTPATGKRSYSRQ